MGLPGPGRKEPGCPQKSWKEQQRSKFKDWGEGGDTTCIFTFPSGPKAQQSPLEVKVEQSQQAVKPPETGALSVCPRTREASRLLPASR